MIRPHVDLLITTPAASLSLRGSWARQILAVGYVQVCSKAMIWVIYVILRTLDRSMSFFTGDPEPLTIRLNITQG
jgi:hypothetical protein